MSELYNGAMITLARESRGLTQTDLARKVGVPQGTISKAESGTLHLNKELVERVGAALQYPDPFFSQTDPIYPFGSTTFYHRKLQAVPAPTLRKIEAKVNIYRFHVARLLRATDLDKRCRFRRIDPEEHGGNIEEVAQLTRSAWRLPTGPVQNVVRSIEDAGGIVVRFDFETAKMFGLSEWIPPAPPLFFLNSNPTISADRDRFTLAHELAHVILHNLPHPNMEAEANRFAAEFLTPAREIRQHLVPPIQLHTVARLKPFWRVSMAQLIQRAKDLKVINNNQFIYLRIQLQQRGYRYREPAELDVEREQPSLLLEVIQEHLSTLGFGYSDLADMVSMHISEFRFFHQLNNNPGGLSVVSA
jgi:Zn-dependent peptidase ImmA (M78 family)/transcriptional regulator with XRE-family HTH domain